MFWRLAKKDFSIFANQDSLSFPDIQKMNAILDMEEANQLAFSTYQKDQQEKAMNKIKSKG